MSPDSSYGRYETPTPTDNNMMGPVHSEREPELHIGMTFSLVPGVHWPKMNNLCKQTML